MRLRNTSMFDGEQDFYVFLIEVLESNNIRYIAMDYEDLVYLFMESPCLLSLLKEEMIGYLHTHTASSE